MTDPRTAALFDFDKTLVSVDSFILFSLYASSSLRQRLGAIGLAGLCKLGIVTNSEYKRRVLNLVWRKKSPRVRELVLSKLLKRLQQIFRPTVLGQLKRHLADGSRVVVLSASPTFYLKPFLAAVDPRIEVQGTNVTFATDGRVESIANLYGIEKVYVATEILREHAGADTVFFTDSISDLPVISLVSRAKLVSPSRRLVRALRRRGIPFEVLLP